MLGVLASTSPAATVRQLAGFREGLAAEGFIEGRNLLAEYRWAEGHYDRLAAMATDLVRRRVGVITALALPAALAAKAATSDIPVVFYSGSDPVAARLVESLARPGGNLTGVSALFSNLNPKRVQLLHELLPKVAVFGLLVNPELSTAPQQVALTQQAIRAVGLRLVVAEASTEDQLAAAFASLADTVGGLMLSPDPFFGARLDRIVALAARYRLPAIYHFRQAAVAGGLISYGDSLIDTWRQVGVYTGKVLRGARPADLPVQQPTKFELVINLKTAKALGIAVPQSLLAQADEVIE